MEYSERPVREPGRRSPGVAGYGSYMSSIPVED